jgi:hypothetical protein
MVMVGRLCPRHSDHSTGNLSTPSIARCVFKDGCKPNYDEAAENFDCRSFHQRINDIQKGVYVAIHEL